MGSEHNNFSIKNYYPREIAIDDADLAGEKLPIRIRRFTVAELKEFQRGYERLINPLSARFIYRRPDGDEQALRGDEKTYVVDLAEIQRRREAEMSPEMAIAYAKAKDDDDAFAADFSSRSIAAHVWLAPHVKLSIEGNDGEVTAVKDGAGLVAAFGGNLSFLVRTTQAIYEENTLTPEAKKVLRSLSDSTASSPRRRGDGKTPAAIAASAAPAGTASTDGALEVPEINRSGSTRTVM